MSWETVAQIVTIIAALAISPIMLVIFTNLMNKRIDDILESIKDLRTELKDCAQLAYERGACEIV